MRDMARAYAQEKLQPRVTEAFETEAVEPEIFREMGEMGLLGVTVLTSMDDADLVDAGYHDTAETLVARRARQAFEAGMGGIVCSAAEARAVREIVGPDMAVVTPGIRPAGAAAGDQKRVVTPADAIAAGASHLVVGRPVVAASDRTASALAILEEIESAA